MHLFIMINSYFKNYYLLKVVNTIHWEVNPIKSTFVLFSEYQMVPLYNIVYYTAINIIYDIK